MTIELIPEVEFADAIYYSQAMLGFFVPAALDVGSIGLCEFSEYIYFSEPNQFYSQGTVVVGEPLPLEMSPSVYMGPSHEVVYNSQSRLAPDYLEMLPVVLPMLPGDDAFEIALVYRDTPDTIITLEDLMDLLTYAGDIRLSLEDGAGTLEIKQNDLERDAGLETALLVSLFSDRRATVEQVQAAGLDDKDLRGWWGDQDQEEPIGSLVWLLGRAKMTSQTLTQFREYALQSWQWLIRDGAAERIDATVERADLEELAITVTVRRPRAAEDVNFRWHYNWQAQQVRRA